MAWLGLASPAVYAQTMESVELNAVNGNAVIWIHFAAPIAYQKHFPTDSGHTLLVYFKIAPVGASVSLAPREIKSFLRSSQIKGLPLIDVTYEGGGSEGPHVVLRFRKSVKFTVQPGVDGRSITVSVPLSRKANGVNKASGKADDGKVAEPYVLTLFSSFDQVGNLASLENRIKQIVPNVSLYVVRALVLGKQVSFVRLGFFPSKDDALSAKEQLQALYPQAWATPVGSVDRSSASGRGGDQDSSDEDDAELELAPASGLTLSLLKPREGAQSVDKPPAVGRKEDPAKVAPATRSDAKDIERLMAEGKAALAKGDSSRAIKAFETLLSFQEHSKTQEAHELLALAMEGNGQVPMALVEYNLYLKRYSEGEAAERVRKHVAILGSGLQGVNPPETAGVSATISSSESDPIEQFMTEGKEALTKGENTRAIKAFNNVLILPQGKHTRDAHELLGLALERSGKTESARVEYQLYLKVYPEGEASERVRQRLANLVVDTAPVAVLRPSKEKENEKEDAGAGAWSLNGMLMQDYFYGLSQTKVTSTVTGVTVQEPPISSIDQKFLSTRVSLNGRYTSAAYDDRVVFDGDLSHSYLPGGTQQGRVSTLYAEVNSKQNNYLLKVGRQSGSSGGVMGRFGGASLSYRIDPKWRLNVVGGMPTDSIAMGSERKFGGVSMEMGTFAEHWGGSMFFIQQQVDQVVDRRAVGGEMRYFHQKGSAFSLIDYDVYHGSPNLFMFQGNLRSEDNSSYNLLIDIRKSPYQLTTNALMGETVASIAGLMAQGVSEADLKARVKAYSATTRTVSLGAYRPLTEKYQIGGDVSATNTSGTPALGNYPGSEESGTTVTYSMQLIGNKLLFSDDMAVVNLGRSKGKTFVATNLGLTTRVRHSEYGYISPSLRYYRQSTIFGTASARWMPSIRADYTWRKKVTFEFEYQREMSESSAPTQSDQTIRDFYRAGWRMDF